MPHRLCRALAQPVEVFTEMKFGGSR